MSTGPADQQPAPLPPAALGLIRLHGAWLPFGALVCAAFAVTCVVAGEVLVAVAPAIAAVALVVLWWRWTDLRFRAYRWWLTDETVELRSGVWFRSHSVLPRNRVQNVSKTSGPVQRRAGLATVVVHSAGAHTPDIVIPHLRESDADALRDVLAPRAAGAPDRRPSTGSSGSPDTFGDG